jgi:hypothetical protein
MSLTVFYPSKQTQYMEFEDYMKEKEAHRERLQGLKNYIEDALKLPGEDLGEWLNAFMDLNQIDQDELLEQARKEMTIS